MNANKAKEWLPLVCLCAMALTILHSGAVWAHKGSDAFLTGRVEAHRMDGFWDVHLRDVAVVFAIDDNDDRAITWGELSAHAEELAMYLRDRVQFFNSGEACDAALAQVQVNEHSDGVYAQFPLTVICPTPISVLTIRYRFLFDVDAQHRALVSIASDAGTQSRVISADTPEIVIAVNDQAVMPMLVDYAQIGVWHIWTGFDHVLFVVALLLGAVRVKETPPEPFRAWTANILTLVTAFTLAHSITLVLTVMGAITIPSRLVEAAIALSVAIAAVNNIWNILGRHLAKITFVFGLVHGMGFAGALSDLGLPSEGRAFALAAFNVGVEAGQLAILALLLPVVYAMRVNLRGVQRAVTFVSIAIASAGAIWFLDRTM